MDPGSRRCPIVLIISFALKRLSRQRLEFLPATFVGDLGHLRDHYRPSVAGPKKYRRIHDANNWITPTLNRLIDADKPLFTGVADCQLDAVNGLLHPGQALSGLFFRYVTFRRDQAQWDVQADKK